MKPKDFTHLLAHASESKFIHQGKIYQKQMASKFAEYMAHHKKHPFIHGIDFRSMSIGVFDGEFEEEIKTKKINVGQYMRTQCKRLSHRTSK